MANRQPDKLARTQDGCFLCGYNRVEMHHVVPKRMGGSKEADTPSNLMPLCPKHHRMVTENIIQLRIEDDHVHVIQGGAIVASRPLKTVMPEQIGRWTHVLRNSLDTVAQNIEYLPDETLKELYHACSELGKHAFAMQCEVAYTLFTRAIGTYESKVNQVAQILGLKSTSIFYRVKARLAFGPMLQNACVPEATPSHLMVAASTPDPLQSIEVLKKMGDDGPVSVAKYKQALQDLKQQDSNSVSQPYSHKCGLCEKSCPHRRIVEVCEKHSRIVKPGECPEGGQCAYTERCKHRETMRS